MGIGRLVILAGAGVLWFLYQRAQTPDERFVVGACLAGVGVLAWAYSFSSLG